MNERRRLPRTEIWRSAEIEMSAATVAECIVVDISMGGAQLLLPADLQPDDEFNFSFDHFRSTRQCRVAWRKNRNIGVAFLAPQAA